jgi:ABC-type transporter Mla MlaB component
MHSYWRKAGGAMLRITHAQTETEHKAQHHHWMLCGQLAGPWVAELRTCFNSRSAGAAHLVVDLSDVTFIDESGEILLAEMRSAGAEFVARGVETQHLLKNLKAKGGRALRRLNAPLGPCGNAETTKGEEK